MNLQNSVVVVTGAARGLGKAIAGAFAQQGARVALVDLLTDELEQTATEMRATGADVLPVVADVTDVQQVDEMAQQILDAFGPADVLVNCAGTFSVIGPVWEVDPERWLRDIRVNLYGSFLISWAVWSNRVPATSSTSSAPAA